MLQYRRGYNSPLSIRQQKVNLLQQQHHQWEHFDTLALDNQAVLGSQEMLGNQMVFGNQVAFGNQVILGNQAAASRGVGPLIHREGVWHLLCLQNHNPQL